MKVRSITADELEQFASFGDQPTPAAISNFREVARKLRAEGSSRPEWFFLAEQNDQPVGRVAYWRLKSRPEELRMMTLKLPWEGRYLDIGLALLLESWEQLKTSRARYVVRQLLSFWDYLDEQREVLELAGMTLLQEKQSYLWNPGGPIQTPERLDFRSVKQVGEVAFIDAIRRVTVGVMDREIRAMGGAAAAQQLFEILKEDTEFHEEWAQLAYNSQGQLIGLVAPVGMPGAQDEGSIAYIGVTPDQRGRGYIDGLLSKGMAVLQSVGFTAVYSETDSENIPMRRAFERAGHRPYCQAWLYRGRL